MGYRRSSTGVAGMKARHNRQTARAMSNHAWVGDKMTNGPLKRLRCERLRKVAYHRAFPDGVRPCPGNKQEDTA